MNTKNVADTQERKELKRKARKAAEVKSPKQPRAAGVDRGSMKRKVKTIAKGQRKR
ncbi:MAG: hypothetical protein HZB13_05105 [Acidobacteria bacterium]|nr:hypothetical protein [Acidobacteriota bacterium]